MSSDGKLAALQRAVEHMHGVPATFVGSTAVHEKAGGLTVWQGVVSQFYLEGHATAESCYAWSVPSSADNSKERYYAVLKTPDIDTPTKAVRASIVADNR